MRAGVARRTSEDASGGVPYTHSKLAFGLANVNAFASTPVRAVVAAVQGGSRRRFDTARLFVDRLLPIRVRGDRFMRAETRPGDGCRQARRHLVQVIA